MTKKDQTRSAIVLAIRRIEVGRPRVVEKTRALSIAAVAQEAGISDSLIHTRYPDLADRIRKIRTVRSKSGRGNVEMNLKQRIAELKAELRQLKADFACLADKNHVLTIENEYMRVSNKSGKVVPIRSGQRGIKR